MKKFSVKLKDEFDFLTGYDCNLECYVCDKLIGDSKDKKFDAVLITPGGAYFGVSDREGEPVALRFMSEGFCAFVLRYSTRDVCDDVYPVQLLQVAAAMLYIKNNAKSLNIDPDRVSVCGFSAGGHLAGLFGCMYSSKTVLDAIKKCGSDDVKPYKLALCYPVISSQQFPHRDSFNNLFGSDEKLKKQFSLENVVSDSTPPTFLWHTSDDNVVPSINSLIFASELAKRNILYELHIYPSGSHGLSLATPQTSNAHPHMENPTAANWFVDALRFLKG